MKRLCLLLILPLIFTNIACETEEDNKIAQAQACLDNAIPSTASNCTTFITGLTSTDSYAIRCAADFIAGGLTSARIISAVGQMQDKSGGTDPALTLMGIVAFGSSAAATQAYDDCSKSGSSSFLFFASAAQMGTMIGSANGGSVISTIAAGGTPSQAQIDAALADAISNPNPTNNAVIGNVVTNLASTECVNPSDAQKKVCDAVNAAIASNPGNAAAIGAALLAQLQN